MFSNLFVRSVKRASSSSAYEKWQEQILEMRKVAYKDPLSRSRMSAVGIQQVEDSLKVMFLIPESVLNCTRDPWTYCSVASSNIQIRDVNCYGVDNPRFLKTYPTVHNEHQFRLPTKIDIKKLKYPRLKAQWAYGFLISRD